MPFTRAIIGDFTYVPKDEIDNISSYRDRFTVASRYKEGPVISYYKETENLFGIPRHGVRLSQSLASAIVDKRALGTPINLDFKGELWDYQIKAIEDFNGIIQRGGTGVFLESDPGTGKTVMGLKMLSLLNTTTLIVVPKSDLVKQWIDRALTFTNIRRKDIGIIQAGQCNYKKKKLVIGLIHSVVLERHINSVFCNYFGAVLFDECDSSVPPKTFSSASSLFYAKYRIGMTASSTRADGLHVIFEDSLAQFKIKCSNTKTLAPSVLIHKFTQSSGKLPSYLKGLSKRGVLISLLANNPIRNDLIARYAVRSYNSNRVTTVMSDRKEQLQTIRDLLIKTYKINPKQIGFFVRSIDGKELKQEEKDRSANESKIILATYGMMSRGTDIPRLETLILATIRSDMRQTLGRIVRVMQGKQTPVVIDVLDTTYPQCVRSYKNRLRFYEERGLKIQGARS